MSHMHQNAPLAYPYVPAQQFTKRYSDDDAIIRGTLFPELDLPFKDFEIRKHLPCTPMTEWMKVDFVRHELRLYLDVHPNDVNAAKLYMEYKQKCEEAKKAVQDQSQKPPYESWVYDPWPWE